MIYVPVNVNNKNKNNLPVIHHKLQRNLWYVAQDGGPKPAEEPPGALGATHSMRGVCNGGVQVGLHAVTQGVGGHPQLQGGVKKCKVAPQGLRTRAEHSAPPLALTTWVRLGAL